MINLNFTHFFQRKKSRPSAKVFSTSDRDLLQVARLIKQGEVVAFPFNGIFGLFADLDNARAAERIYLAKNRPKDKKLVLITSPEHIAEHIQIDKIPVSLKQLINFWKEIHALGIILPSKKTEETVLNIWTEYPPLRKLFEYFRELGGTAFIGTSANKSGQPTYFAFEKIWQNFRYDVDVIVKADFNDLEPGRKKSTTVVRLTDSKILLHRMGNVEEKELNFFIKKHKLPPLERNNDVIVLP